MELLLEIIMIPAVLAILKIAVVILMFAMPLIQRMHDFPDLFSEQK